MANKKSTSNNILVKKDQNNVIYIDPNSVLSEDNIAVERQVEPENLVMFVDLEADLIPRTKLIVDNSGDKPKSAFLSIAKGTLNFLQNQNGRDYDTTWTNAYSDRTAKNNKPDEFAQYDSSAQSFGIETIDIKIEGMSFIPSVNIKFIDVRGKTLFESPENSPYKAFFHLPWPIFYLTIKGYFGKAIRYRLHLVDFKSRFNSSTGNFEIETSFVGSTYAYLCDIPLDGILNAAYMYGNEEVVGVQTNEGKTTTTVKVSKSSRGFSILSSVFDTYKKMGLLPNNVPVKTLREIVVIAKRLDKILEAQIFEKVIDQHILAGIRDFEILLENFRNNLYAWKLRYLNPGNAIVDQSDSTLYAIAFYSTDERGLSFIVDPNQKGSLAMVANESISSAKGNAAFGEQAQRTFKKPTETFTIRPILFGNLQNITPYVQTVVAQGNTTYYVRFDKLISDFENYQTNFTEQNAKIEKILEKEMNAIILSPSVMNGKEGGFGFMPTIRTIIGIILANAETYVRLLEDVHQRAFLVGDERKTKLTNITDSIGDAIYPWPEVILPTSGKKTNVLVYPGSEVALLGSDNPRLWPEVEFVEQFISIATKQKEPLEQTGTNPDNIVYVFDDTAEIKKYDISTLTFLTNYIPYFNKTISGVLYEIWERAKYATTVDSFNSATIGELAKLEFDNIKDLLGDDNDILDILNKIVTAPANKNNIVPEFQNKMKQFSPISGDTYYKDQIPNTGYIMDSMEKGYNIEKYSEKTQNTANDQSNFTNLSNNLKNYVSESYRTKIYPFTSKTYLDYLKITGFTQSELNVQGILGITPENSFISSPKDSKMWVKENMSSNLFTNTVEISEVVLNPVLTINAFDYSIQTYKKHILNTPYFHKRLYNDFRYRPITGKYAPSAYLLLNSLPFKDLDDKIGTGVLMSSLFREIGATHYIPYHLMLKWGSIYHRYKTYLKEGIDIISEVNIPIDSNLFFDNSHNGFYVFPSEITKTDEYVDRTSDIGFMPAYQDIFSQIINGRSFYNSTDPAGYNESYKNAVVSGAIRVFNKSMTNGIAWTSFMDNSKYDKTDARYTLLPSNGGKLYDLTNYNLAEQENYRILWTNLNDDGIPVYSGHTFPATDQYFKNIDNLYTLADNNKKVLDLIATFKPDILDEFEKAFLDFASPVSNSDVPYQTFTIPDNVKNFYKFQVILKEISSVYKNANDTSNDTMLRDELISLIQTKQEENLKSITNTMLSDEFLVQMTLGNPKEINTNLLGGITQIDVVHFDANPYDVLQLTDENKMFIKLYLGEDIDGYYQEFFRVNNIELNEENVKKFRFLIYIYAGFIKSTSYTTDTEKKEAFTSHGGSDGITNPGYLKTNIIDGNTTRLANFLRILLGYFHLLKPAETSHLTIQKGYSDDNLKLELYNFFKSFNDKWTAGNSIGQRTLMEEFLFLDKANRDIGNSAFVDMTRLTAIETQKDKHKISLYSLINILIKDTGFDMRPLPAYVNFYEPDASGNNAVPSKDVAKNMFGMFLDVDYQKSLPKILLMYVGPSSKHPDMESSMKYGFKNDGFDIFESYNNPVMVDIGPEIFTNNSIPQSNKVVAFEVSFGDINQSIFKGLELDQSTIKNTSASYAVLERLGNSETGSSTAQIDIGLMDIFRQASYSVKVTCMGNVMIQPTMYFYLKNIPMFKGSYWITEVTHKITSASIETTFTGSRIPFQSLPDPADSFLASYRSLFDKIKNDALMFVKSENAKINKTEVLPTSTPTVQTPTVTPAPQLETPMAKYTPLPGETIVARTGITEYGIYYNKADDITLINANGEWLKTNVVLMGGSIYSIDDSTEMDILTHSGKNNSKDLVTWGDIKNTSKDHFFYCTKFDYNDVDRSIIENDYKVEFFNPQNLAQNFLTNDYDFDNKEFTGLVHNGPSLEKYGVGMSFGLMKVLGLTKDDILYFRLLKK